MSNVGGRLALDVHTGKHVTGLELCPVSRFEPALQHLAKFMRNDTLLRAEAGEPRMAAAVRSSAVGLCHASSAPVLPRSAPYRASVAELKARVKLTYASSSALLWAASGAAGVGGHAGMAAAAAAVAVRRVGDASAVQIYGKLPGTGCDAPAAAVARPAEAKPSRPNAMCAFGESYRSTRPGRSSLPFLAYPPEQTRPRCII